MTEKVNFGYGNDVASLELDKLNRHGMIAGATGTGKTITLKVLAEQMTAIDSTTLILCVGIGVGLFLSIATLRIIFQIKLMLTYKQPIKEHVKRN